MDDPRFQQCGYCGKWVKDGRFLGTLHICLDPEDIERIDRRRALLRQIAAAQVMAQYQADRNKEQAMGLPPLSLAR